MPILTEAEVAENLARIFYELDGGKWGGPGSYNKPSELMAAFSCCTNPRCWQ